jgi:hypothetical protein
MLSRFATTGGGGDPYWSSVKTLVVGNGTIGSTTFTDQSSNNFSVTNNGGVTVGSNSKYGTGSMLFSPSNYLSVASGAAVNPGTGDFTIEMWMCPTSYDSYNYLYLASSLFGGLLITLNSGNIILRAYYDQDVLTSSTSPPLNTWSYLTVTRSSGTARIFLNGTIVASGTTNYNFIAGTSSFICGSSIESVRFNGNIYDLRVTIGVARYTSNFTPPTAPLPIG